MIILCIIGTKQTFIEHTRWYLKIVEVFTKLFKDLWAIKGVYILKFILRDGCISFNVYIVFRINNLYSLIKFKINKKLLTLIETISPVVFLNFFNWRKKYQNRDLATMGSGEKILILYRGGFGSLSEGNLRPMTSYSFNCENIS